MALCYHTVYCLHNVQTVGAVETGLSCDGVCHTHWVTLVLSSSPKDLSSQSFDCTKVVSSYNESRNDKPMYGYMLPNLSPIPNLYKVQSVYNNYVAS